MRQGLNRGFRGYFKGRDAEKAEVGKKIGLSILRVSLR